MPEPGPPHLLPPAIEMTDGERKEYERESLEALQRSVRTSPTPGYPKPDSRGSPRRRIPRDSDLRPLAEYAGWQEARVELPPVDKPGDRETARKLRVRGLRQSPRAAR